MFTQRVLKIAASIPSGKTLSCKQVADKAGNQKAYRAVGNILSKNYNLKIPCHRVIRSDGSAGGYNRGTKAKIEAYRRPMSAHLVIIYSICQILAGPQKKI
jgi:methylated-DNA-[protein]-cysteine S-methyltransferase